MGGRRDQGSTARDMGGNSEEIGTKRPSEASVSGSEEGTAVSNAVQEVK